MSASVTLSFKIPMKMAQPSITAHSMAMQRSVPPYNLLKISGRLRFSCSPLTPLLQTVLVWDCPFFSLLLSVFHPGQPSHGIQNTFSFGGAQGLKEIPKSCVSSRLQRKFEKIEEFTFKQRSHHMIDRQTPLFPQVLPPMGSLPTLHGAPDFCMGVTCSPHSLQLCSDFPMHSKSQHPTFLGR